MIKEIIGTTTLIALNNVGLLLILFTEGYLKYIGYFDYLATGSILYFVVTIYMESNFYKNLGKEKCK